MRSLEEKKPQTLGVESSVMLWLEVALSWWDVKVLNRLVEAQGLLWHFPRILFPYAP